MEPKKYCNTLIVSVTAIFVILTISVFSTFYYLDNEKIKKEHQEKITSLEEENEKYLSKNDSFSNELEEIKSEYASLLTHRHLLQNELDILKENNSSTNPEDKVVSKAFEKRIVYETKNMSLANSYIENKEKITLVSQLRKALKDKSDNEIVVVEGHADSIMFLEDPENKKNLKLSVKRIVDNVFSTLTESEINTLYLKVNTLEDKRVVRVYILSFNW